MGPAAAAACVIALLPVPVLATPPAYLEAPALDLYSATSEGFTVEFWVRVRSQPGFDPRIVRAANDDPGPCSYPGAATWDVCVCHLSDCPTGGVQFQLQADGRCWLLNSPLRVDDGAFHHVACVVDRTEARVVFDGEVTVRLPAEDVRVAVGGGTIVVGNATDHRNPLDGEVDELRIWNVARTVEEIRECMFRELPETEHLVGYWRFDGSGEDRAPSGNDLVPHNTVRFRRGKLGGSADIVNADALRGLNLAPSAPVPGSHEPGPEEGMRAQALVPPSP